MSMLGSPSAIHSATIRPMPPAWVIHLAIGGLGELGERLGPDQLVLEDRERDGDAGQPAELRTPDPAAQQDLLTLDRAVVGPDAVDASPLDVEAGHRDTALERDP